MRFQVTCSLSGKNRVALIPSAGLLHATQWGAQFREQSAQCSWLHSGLGTPKCRGGEAATDEYTFIICLQEKRWKSVLISSANRPPLKLRQSSHLLLTKRRTQDATQTLRSKEMQVTPSSSFFFNFVTAPRCPQEVTTSDKHPIALQFKC